MKVRNGFVSNSSSSSFVVCDGYRFDSGYGAGKVCDGFSALVPKKAIPELEEYDDCPFTWLEKNLPKEFFHEWPEDGSNLVIGIPYSSMKMNQTRGEFEREFAIEALRMFPSSHTFQRRIFGSCNNYG